MKGVCWVPTEGARALRVHTLRSTHLSTPSFARVCGSLHARVDSPHIYHEQGVSPCGASLRQCRIPAPAPSIDADFEP